MTTQHGNPGIIKNNLQLYYNREFLKSFRGEATTNIVSNTTDFSGLSYAGYNTEWTDDPTRFTKSYNSTLETPIGKTSEGVVRNYSVEKIQNNKVYIYTDNIDNIYNYYYVVYGERKDVEKLTIEKDI